MIDERIVLPTLVALLGMACAGTLAAHRPLSESAITEINGTLEGESPEVVLADERQPAKSIQAKEVKVGRDTTQWLELPQWQVPQWPVLLAHERLEHPDETWRPRTVPTAALKSASIRKHGWGALEGLGFGLLSGAIAGAFVGVASGDNSHSCLFCTWQVNAFAGAILGAIPGILLGTMLGAAIGHRTTVEFDDSASASPRPAVEEGIRNW
jgi:hypothetical protein